MVDPECQEISRLHDVLYYTCCYLRDFFHRPNPYPGSIASTCTFSLHDLPQHRVARQGVPPRHASNHLANQPLHLRISHSCVVERIHQQSFCHMIKVECFEARSILLTIFAAEAWTVEFRGCREVKVISTSVIPPSPPFPAPWVLPLAFQCQNQDS
jgi:hypothetical protein